MKNLTNTFLVLLIVLTVFSCKKKDDDETVPTSKYGLGYQNGDDPSGVPVIISFGAGAGNLPAAKSLVDKFPPIGNQGSYGTCVAWAAAYNIKTALEGLDKNWDATQLNSSANQYSPLDLFTAIPDNQKDVNCLNGTNFIPALDVMRDRGVATLNVAPYANISSCAQSNLQSSWNASAGTHKILSHRRIDKTVDAVKTAISDNIPVLFGGKVTNSFQSWNSDNVFSSLGGAVTGYHAIAVSGYDDNKGPNGAFRVTNSWGTTWGDLGYIWIDYNFFINEFVSDQNLYTFTNDKGGAPIPVDPTVTGGADIASWAFADISIGGTDRNIEYNIYNIGDQAANSSQAWSVYYIYYNAYDASEYGFLIENNINNTIPANTVDCSGGPCILNYNLPSGDNLANVLFPGNVSFFQDYTVPNSLNGEYYLLIIADALDGYNETDEQNNYFYTTDQYPVTFINGVVQKSTKKTATYIGNYSFNNKLAPSQSNLKRNPFQTTVNKNNPNSYAIGEIRQMIKNEKKSGGWDSKLQAFRNSHKDGSTIRKK